MLRIPKYLLILVCIICLLLSSNYNALASSNLNAPTFSRAVPSDTSVDLQWIDNSLNELGFILEIKKGNEFILLAKTGTNQKTFTVDGLSPNNWYTFRIKAFDSLGQSDYSEIEVYTPRLDTQIKTTLVFNISSNRYSIKKSSSPTISWKEMDTPPLIYENRTMLPIKYVAQELGATVNWEPTTRMITVNLASRSLKLWVDNRIAMVNGSSVPIDPNSESVKPIIVPPGRTILPFRFIAENLGCSVDWNSQTKEITLTYPK